MTLLTRDLRLLRFDALYRNNVTDQDGASIPSRDGRIVRSRENGLACCPPADPTRPSRWVTGGVCGRNSARAPGARSVPRRPKPCSRSSGSSRNSPGPRAVAAFYGPVRLIFQTPCGVTASPLNLSTWTSGVLPKP